MPTDVLIAFVIRRTSSMVGICFVKAYRKALATLKRASTSSSCMKSSNTHAKTTHELTIGYSIVKSVHARLKTCRSEEGVYI